MKTAIYTRVSTDKQEKDGTSLQTQLEACQKYCAENGLEVTHEFGETYSGLYLERPKLTELRELATTKSIDTVVAYCFDRFSRDPVHFIILEEEFQKAGVELRFVTETLDSSDLGRLISHVKGYASKLEAQKIKERTRRGKRARVRENKWNGGYLPFGYTYNNDKMSDNYSGKLEIDQVEAEVVRGMFEMIDNGMTLGAWCKFANKQGLTTKRQGKGWTVSRVSNILRNPIYIGKGFYGKKSEHRIPLEYPQIVPEDMFIRVQGRLRENQKKNKGTTKNTYLLSHLGRCHCGARLGCRTSKGHKYMYCFSQKNYPETQQCYKPIYWKLEPIEEYIWNEVAYVLQTYRDGTYDLLLERFEEGKAERDKQIAKAKEELQRCHYERQKLIAGYRKGLYSEAEAEPHFAKIKEEEEYWQEQISSLESLHANGDGMWNEFWNQIKQVHRMFNYGFDLSLEQQKILLNTLLEEFVLDKDGTIELRFKLPVSERQVEDAVVTLLTSDTS